MEFSFSEDQELLRQNARAFLVEHSPITLCREIFEGESSYAETLWKEAAGLGFQGTIVPEAYGGAGLGHLELAVIAEEMGRAMTPLPFSSSVYVATEALIAAGTEEQKSRYLPALARGDAVGGFALAATATEPPGVEIMDGRFTGTRFPIIDGVAATFAVVSACDEAGSSLYLVDLGADGVHREPVGSFDSSRTLARVQFADVEVERLGDPGAGPELGEQLRDRAAILTAFEQLGAASAAFEQTREFILDRFAFGRAIGSFQSIKHRMADLWCEIELARSNAYFGAWALSTNAQELALAACISRIQASETFDAVATEMIQLHGGVGFTWEHDCHLYYRRARWLATALGAPHTWKARLADLIAPVEA